MTQTTGAITLHNLYIEYSLNGTDWTDISGYSNSITPGGGDREIGTVHTADGDTPIIGAGKRAEHETTVRIVYTEGASEPTTVMRTAWKNASLIYLRWAPKGNSSGNYQFTSTAGLIRSPILPEGEVQSGDPVTVEFVLVHADFSEAAIV